MNTSSSIAAPLFLVTEAARAAQGEASSRLAESPLSTANLLETALGLVAVLAIMLALAWLVKRYVQVPGIGKGQVQVLGGVSLGAREKAVLLSVGGRRLLVGIAPGQVRTLIVLDDAGDGDEGGADFERQLRAAAADAGLGTSGGVTP
jgi:flagellar protein FliO/FliZ